MSIAQQMQRVVSKLKGFDRVLHEIKFISAGEGSVLCEVKVTDKYVNSMGNLHSGYIATVVDVISGMGLLTHENGFKSSVSIDVNVNYTGTAKVGDIIEISGETVKLGKSLGFLKLDIKNKNTGEIIASGTHTKYMLDKELEFLTKN